MAISTASASLAIEAFKAFYKVIGDINARTQSRTDKQCEIDELRLENDAIDDALEKFEIQLKQSLSKQKAEIQHDAINRGFGNSTVPMSFSSKAEAEHLERMKEAGKEAARAKELIGIRVRKTKGK